jgi:hypothetical protein
MQGRHRHRCWTRRNSVWLPVSEEIAEMGVRGGQRGVGRAAGMNWTSWSSQRSLSKPT